MTYNASAFSHIADYYWHLYSSLTVYRRKDCWLRLRLIMMVCQMRQAASDHASRSEEGSS